MTQLMIPKYKYSERQESHPGVHRCDIQMTPPWVCLVAERIQKDSTGAGDTETEISLGGQRSDIDSACEVQPESSDTESLQTMNTCNTCQGPIKACCKDYASKGRI